MNEKSMLNEQKQIHERRVNETKGKTQKDVVE